MCFLLVSAVIYLPPHQLSFRAYKGLGLERCWRALKDSLIYLLCITTCSFFQSFSKRRKSSTPVGATILCHWERDTSPHTYIHTVRCCVGWAYKGAGITRQKGDDSFPPQPCFLATQLVCTCVLAASGVFFFFFIEYNILRIGALAALFACLRPVCYPSRGF